MTSTSHIYNRRAPIEHEILPLLAERWSPRALVPQELEVSIIRQMLEAGRWSASCVNEQPWRFVVALRSDFAKFEQAVNLLAAGNQTWAKDAGALVLAVASNLMQRNQSPNAWAEHDLGMSVAQIYLQAQSMGYCVHAMGGFDVEQSRKAYGIPEDCTPIVMLAIGKAMEITDVERSRLDRELGARKRNPQSSFVFSGSWNQPLESAQEQEIAGVLDFWFGPVDEDGMASAEKRATWWKKDEAFDKELVARFGALYERIVAGQCESWKTSSRGLLAYVVVLDQFSRNMFRGTNKMFAADPQARAAALAGIASGLDRGVVGEPRGFLYLPLMHSENLEDQRHCIRCYEVFAAESSPRLREALAGNIKFGHAHKQIIETWGRFPHRNAALGRESSAEEIAFLATPNSSF